MNKSTYSISLPFWILVVMTTLMLYSCAQQGTLSGGPKDLQPPRLDTTLSSKNFKTNYYPTSISLYFDEWIQLKNQSQILISPPLEFRPEISSNGKHVDVIFDEEEILRDSTTYAINFGNAIVDFTESNPIPNYRFVFATGDKIDSLELKIKVVDSYSREPVDDVTVMLYDEIRDSVVYEQRPYYFARTDKEGVCTIKNLRSGRFKCFALLDSDFNFLYNQEDEKIGFLESPVLIQPDSLPPLLGIELFLPDPVFQLTEQTLPYRGKLKILANRIVDSISLIETNMDFINQEVLHDSIFYWYRPDTTTSDSIFMVFDMEGKLDTITVKSKKTTKLPGKIMYDQERSKRLTVNPGMPASFTFNQIIDTIDTTHFSLLTVLKKPVADSIEVEARDTIPQKIPFSAEIDSIDLRTIHIVADFEEGESYDLSLYPGAIQGYFDNQNDTLVSKLRIETGENLGNVICRFDSLDENQQYVVMLMKSKTVLDTKIIADTVSQQITFSLVKPSKYFLEVIVDENRNGRWDPGNYREKRQSERKLEIQLEEVRKNWDIETDIKWDSP